MVDATPAPPQTTNLSDLLAWLRGVGAGAVPDDAVAESLADGLYYEVQETLGPLAPDGDDFFSREPMRRRGETAADWAQRSLKGLVMNLGEEQGAQAASRGAQRSVGLLGKSI